MRVCGNEARFARGADQWVRPHVNVYGALGELDEAFAWLGRACEERDPELTYVKVPGRRFEPLRRDRRFQEVVRRVGLSG